MKNLGKKLMTLAIATVVTFTLSAQQGNQNFGRKGQNKGQYQQQNYQDNRTCYYLNLNDEQQTQIDDLRLNHQKKMLSMRNQLSEKKAKLRTLSTAEKADMNAINALIEEIGKVKTEMAKERAARKQEVRKLLTEEQRLNFDMHNGRSGKGYGKGHGNGNGYGYGRGNGNGYGRGNGNCMRY